MPGKLGLHVPAAGICLAAGLAVPLAAQAVPPFHVLQHEFTLLFTIVLAPCLYLAGAGTTRRVEARQDLSRSERRSLSLRLGLTLIAICGALAFLVMLVANAVGPGCRFSRGVPFFWITYAPTGLFAWVLGSVVARRGARRRVVVPWLVAVPVATIVHDVLQLLLGPRLLPVDFLLGDLVSLSQRADIAVTDTHLYQRGVLLLVTFLLWNLGSWREEPAARVRVGAAAAALVGIGVLWGSYVGIGWGYGRVLDRLPVTHETERFVFHLDDDRSVTSSFDEIERAATWYLHHLTQLWGIEPERRIDVFVYEDSGEKYDLTGIGAPHAKMGEVHLTLSRATSATVLHELVHALHTELDPTPRILLSRGMLEGTAMAFGSGFAEVPEAHELQAGALASGKLPSAASVLRPFGFVRTREWAAYQAAGSFLGFLVLEHGIEPFLVLQRGFDFREAYGRDLDQLDEDWRAFLATVPVRAGERLRASRSFDPEAAPAYTSIPCPKLGRDPAPAVTEARFYLDREDYEAAFPLLMRLHEEEGEVRWLRSAAQCLERLERYDEAIELVDEALAEEDLEDFEKASLLSLKIDELIRTGSWEALYRAFDVRAEKDLAEGTDDRMVEEVLRQPGLRDDVAAALLAEDEVEKRARFDALVQAHPDSIPLLYLRFEEGLAGAPLSARTAAAIELAETSADSCDLVAGDLAGFLDEHFDDRAYESAERVAGVILDRCTRPWERFLATLALERVAFEKGTLSFAGTQRRVSPLPSG